MCTLILCVHYAHTRSSSSLRASTTVMQYAYILSTRGNCWREFRCRIYYRGGYFMSECMPVLQQIGAHCRYEAYRVPGRSSLYGRKLYAQLAASNRIAYCNITVIPGPSKLIQIASQLKIEQTDAMLSSEYIAGPCVFRRSKLSYGCIFLVKYVYTPALVQPICFQHNIEWWVNAQQHFLYQQGDIFEH